jgi:hypothetical protein
MTDRTEAAKTEPAREPWEPPRVMTEEVRETASPFPSIHRADGSAPGIYYNPS